MTIDSKRRNIVEQTLHGYRDGHKLIAGSAKLDELSASVMARMSDMQPRSLESSSSYISAYPLKKASKYVIARTWPAIEMRRPGCVWTHSLLVDYTIIAKIKDIKTLLNLLQRPKNSDFESYYQPLDVTDIIQIYLPRAKSAESMNIEDITKTITILYDRDEDKILQATHHDECVNEAIAVAVWNQMPPRLRRDCVICTAANLQSSIPEAEVYLLLSGDPDASKAQLSSKVSAQVDDTVKFVALDALRENKTPLRAFLARYIVDSEHPRQSVLKLVGIALNLFSNDLKLGLRGAAIEIASSFSSPNDCRLLKKDLLTGGFFSSINNELTDRAIPLIVSEALPLLESLTGFDDVAAIDYFLNLAFKNNETLLDNIVGICGNHNRNTLGALVIQRTAEILPTEVVSGIRAKAGAKFWLASWNPELLSNRNFWTSLTSKPTNEDWKLLDIKGKIERISFGLLNARMFDELSELVSREPSFFAPYLVRELIHLDSDAQLATFAALRTHRLELMKAMSSACPLTAQLVESLAKDIFLQQYPEPKPVEWQALLAVLPNDGIAVSHFLSYILFFTANHTDLRSAKSLYSYSFQSLHDILSKNYQRELDEIRSRVRYNYSSINYGSEWDLCGCIRKALAKHFVSTRVIDEHFLRCAKDIQTLTALASSMAEITQGRNWLKALLRANLKGDIRLTSNEVSVVKNVIAATHRFF